jgi:ribosomal protein L17
MKHGKRFWQKKLNRSPEHRGALLKNLITSLVVNEQIQTTLAKAKFMARSADLVRSHLN